MVSAKTSLYQSSGPNGRAGRSASLHSNGSARKAGSQEGSDILESKRARLPRVVPVSNKELHEMVSDYQKEEDPANKLAKRNSLLELVWPHMLRKAQNMVSSYGLPFRAEEIVAFATERMIKALDSFDGSRSSFLTYSSIHIHGGILDEMRKLDWVPRLSRSSVRQIRSAKEKLLYELEREPMVSEIAEELGVSFKVCQSMLKEAEVVTVFSLDDTFSGKVEDEEDDLKKKETLADPKSHLPDSELLLEEVWQTITKPLSAKETQILSAYCRDGDTMAEIGDQMELTESRVCQIAANAMDRIETYLIERRDHNSIQADLFREVNDMLHGAFSLREISILPDGVDSDDELPPSVVDTHSNGKQRSVSAEKESLDDPDEDDDASQIDFEWF